MKIYHWISILCILILAVAETPPSPFYPDCIQYSDGVVKGDDERTCSPFDQRRPFYSKSTSEAYLKTFPGLEIRLTYWAFNAQDGSSANKIDALKVQESLDVLNESFKPLNISFALNSFHTINDSLYYWTSLDKLSSQIRQNSKYVDTTAINVYIPYRFTNFKNNLRGAQISSRGFAVNSFEYNTGILVHELGHVLDLKHTHQDFKSTSCERVTRDESDPKYNPDCAGDFVKDTGAMRELNNNTTHISQDCNYMGSLKDCDGTPYAIGENEIKNFMSYTLQHCRDRFTIGQMIRVREYIANDPLGIVNTYVK